MKKKQILIIAILVLVVAAIIFALLFNNRKEIMPDNGNENIYQPEFMTLEEKESFSLPEESKIQVLKRSEDGGVSVYRIIRSDSDVVTDLEAIDKPIDYRN